MTDYEKRRQMDVAIGNARKLFEWDRWMRELPYLRFPASWRIQVIPPFSTGIIRFCASTKEGTNVSVYFDAYDMAGVMNYRPYWEIHPDVDGDCRSFLPVEFELDADTERS